jgi:hypothetical protein
VNLSLFLPKSEIMIYSFIMWRVSFRNAVRKSVFCRSNDSAGVRAKCCFLSIEICRLVLTTTLLTSAALRIPASNNKKSQQTTTKWINYASFDLILRRLSDTETAPPPPFRFIRTLNGTSSTGGTKGKNFVLCFMAQNRSVSYMYPCNFADRDNAVSVTIL